jgi:condensation domain-containing protein/tubulysin polyketide synthase-like protein
VSVPNDQGSADCVIDVIGEFSRKGIELWLENDQLHYKAPKGALAREEIDELRLHRDQIVSFLQRAAGGTEAIASVQQSRARLKRAPLTFTQLARWNLCRLGEGHDSYLVPSAFRLRGPLNIDALQQSVAELVRRHDALRTRIAISDGIPIQEITAPANAEVKVDDLRELVEISREVELARWIEQQAFVPIDVTIGPLFRAQLAIIHEDEHILLLAMDHIVSDGFSMRILLQELFTAYTQATEGREFSLPVIPLQFADYAVWQRNTLESRLAGYVPRLKGCQRLRFPSDRSPTAGTRLGWESATFHVGGKLKAELRRWCGLKGTTLVMGALVAYIALVLRWCNVSEGVFLYLIDGRVNEAARSTIGFFSFPLYLRIKIGERDNFEDLLSQVTDEYCAAYKHADFSYMEAQVPMPEFARNTVFNWVGHDFLNGSAGLGQNSIELSPISIDDRMVARNLELDVEPSVVVFETEDAIEGRLRFPLHRFSVGAMERFVRNVPVFVKELTRQPGRRVRDVSLL